MKKIIIIITVNFTTTTKQAEVLWACRAKGRCGLSKKLYKVSDGGDSSCLRAKGNLTGLQTCV